MNILSSKLKGLNSLKGELQGIDIDVEDSDEKKKLKEMVHETHLTIDTLISGVNEIQKLKMDASLKFTLVKEIANPILSDMENILDQSTGSADMSFCYLSELVINDMKHRVNRLEIDVEYLKLEEMKELYELKGRIAKIEERLNRHEESSKEKLNKLVMETEILNDIIYIQHVFIDLYSVSQSAARRSFDNLNFWKSEAEEIKSKISNVKKTIRENNLNSLSRLEDYLNDIEKLFPEVDERLSTTLNDDSD